MRCFGSAYYIRRLNLFVFIYEYNTNEISETISVR